MVVKKLSTVSVSIYMYGTFQRTYSYLLSMLEVELSVLTLANAFTSHQVIMLIYPSIHVHVSDNNNKAYYEPSNPSVH